jgi:outer membrane immunogenic protein
MIFRVFGLGLASGLVVIGSALAQNQPRTVELPPYQAGQSWTGFYLGLGFGGGAMVDHLSSSAGGVSLSNDASGQGVLASVYGGYDLQVMPKALVGVLAEGTWTSIQSQASANVPGANATTSIQPNLGFSALIRAGMMPTASNLLYLVGGYSGQNFHSTGTASAAGAVASFTRDDFFNGWTLGGGLESKLQGGWSAKLEYRYSQFESKTLPGTFVVASPSTQSVRAGLTYKFGGFDAANGRDTADDTT